MKKGEFFRNFSLNSAIITVQVLQNTRDLMKSTNLFSRIIKYKSRKESKRTAFEDFCTECLAGILESDPHLQRSFIRDVVWIPESEHYQLKTQKYYHFNNSSMIIDMEFSSQESLCFLEMKVHAPEGIEQLNGYKDLLKNRENEAGSDYGSRKVYLRYCTLYKEEKNIKEVDFRQFRWSEIADFLKKHLNDNPLLIEFYKFLKDNNMANDYNFTLDELSAFKHVNPILEKSQSLLADIITPVFKKYLGDSHSINNLDAKRTFQQLKRWNRVSIWINQIVGSRGYSDIVASIDAQGNSEARMSPVVSLSISVNDNNDNYDQFLRIINCDSFQTECPNVSERFEVIQRPEGVVIYYEKSIITFLDCEKQEDAIRDWFRDKIKLFVTFVNDTKTSLDWKI